MHLLALDLTGQVYSFGSNSEGQLGLGPNNEVTAPTLIRGVNNIVQISAGTRHSLLLTADRQVYSFGDNPYGQLSLGDNIRRNIPTLIPANYFNNLSIVQLSAGYNHSLMLTENGEVYSCGFGLFSQLGLGDNNNLNISTLIPELNNIVQLSAGAKHSLILTSEGRVYSFGSTSGGRLGLGSTPAFKLSIPTLID